MKTIDTRKIRIKVDKKAVLLEVAQRAYALGETVTDDDKVRHLLQGATDIGHRDLMERAISDALELAYQAMSPYREYAHEGVEEVTTGALQEDVIVLNVPSRTLPDLARRVARALHSLLVEACMSRWQMMMKQDSKIALMRVSEYAGDIKVLLNTRVGITRQINNEGEL